MKKSLSLLRGLLIAVPLTLLAAPLAIAYHTHDNWCDRHDLLVNIDMDSFTNHGFDQVAIDRHHRTAMTWWSDAQATLRFRYNTIQVDHSQDDPGNVYIQCDTENHSLNDKDAYTERGRGWHPSCDFWGLNMDEWKTVLKANIDNRKCGETDGWAFDIAGVRKYRMPMFLVMAHEYGHALALNHTEDPAALMYEFVGVGMRLSQDDIAGVRKGLGEGIEDRNIYTIGGVPRERGVISFGGSQRLNPKAISMPEIAGNGNWKYRPQPVDFDFSLAWITNDDDRIAVSTGNDDVNGNLVLGTVRTTNERSQHKIGLATGWQNRIGVAWVARGVDRTVNFMVSLDQGQSWTKTEITGQQAMGGVHLTFDWNRYRWIMSWVVLGEQGSSAFKIATLVSNDETGNSWPRAASTYGDDVSSPNLAPAITCGRSDQDSCVMFYRSFATSDIRQIRQQAFHLSTDARRLDAINTDAVTTDYAYSDMGAERMDGTTANTRGYVMTYVWPTTGDSKMTYRIKYDSDGPDTANFVYPRRTLDNEPFAHSRSGYSVAYNHRTQRLRFVWKWQ
jgi:hypothetical protein